MKASCEGCEREYEYKRGRGSTTKYCSTCMTNRRRFRQKQKAVIYLGGKCKLCGYNKSVNALQFHHRDRSTKKFPISGNHARAWDKIVKELDKCDLLCANCHSEVEYGIVPVGQEQLQPKHGTVYPV